MLLVWAQTRVRAHIRFIIVSTQYTIRSLLEFAHFFSLPLAEIVSLLHIAIHCEKNYSAHKQINNYDAITERKLVKTKKKCSRSTHIAHIRSLFLTWSFCACNFYTDFITRIVLYNDEFEIVLIFSI